MKKLFSFLLSLVLIFACTSYLFAEEPYRPVKLEDTPEKVEMSIVPRMELLSGVLAHTTWTEKRGARGKGNEYYRDLKQFFSDYTDHEAIKIAQELTDRGFTYD
ncbi:MAG: hypothetical protein ACOC5A_03205, partial [Halanaerobiales bacterium]